MNITKSYPPEKLLPWINHNESLTLKAELMGLEVRVLVLLQQWRSTIFEREIIMFCNNKPWWYGRTLIPKQTFSKRFEIFSTLSTKPLGKILFEDPMIEKIHCKSLTLSVKDLKLNHQQLGLVEKQDMDLLWGRASIFQIDDSPLYLTEVFLPEML